MHPNDRTIHAPDGTPIAYHISDPELEPTIIYSNGYATSTHYWAHIHAHFRGRARQITWDFRGHGRSGAARDLSAVSIAALARDLGRILEVEGIERATLVGFSFGCQVTLEAWRHFPERIAGIVVALGTFERPFDEVFHPRLGPKLFRVFRAGAPRLGPAMMRAAGMLAPLPFNVSMGKRLGMIEANIEDAEMRPFFEHFRELDGATWAAMGIAAQAHSARDVLPTIKAPTLIIGGGKDVWTPIKKSEEMHALIPHSEYVFLPTATHTGLLGHSGRIITALDGFLSRHQLIDPIQDIPDLPHAPAHVAREEE